MANIATSYRLDSLAIERLKALSNLLAIPQAELLERLINTAYAAQKNGWEARHWLNLNEDFSEREDYYNKPISENAEQ
jgi:hypothetical protein